MSVHTTSDTSEEGFFPQDEDYLTESFVSTALNNIKTHELHQIFGSSFDGNVRVWVTNQVRSILTKNGKATLTAVDTAVSAAIPKLVAALKPFVPDFLLPYVPVLQSYAQVSVSRVLASAYAEVIEILNALPASKTPAK